jgi:hypothetical protein
MVIVLLLAFESGNMIAFGYDIVTDSSRSSSF